MDTATLIEFETCKTLIKATSYNSWYAILSSTIVWCTCYILIQKTFYLKSSEWCNRIVTLIHGFGSAITGLAECATNNFFENWNIPQTDNQQIILLISLGYFIFDLIWCLCYQRESKVMLIHHLMSTIGLFRLLYKNYAGPQTCCGIGGMEVTNPLLQIRWLIRNSGNNRSWFVYADITFVVTFFIMRIGFGTYFFMNVVFYNDFEKEYMLYTSILYIISWLFVVNILQYLFVKYPKTSDRNKRSENPSTNSTVTSAGNTAIENN